MPDDNMQNDDFNPSNNPGDFDDLSNAKHIENESEAFNKDAEIKEDLSFADIESPVRSSAADYDFDEIQGKAINTEEVTIDPSVSANEPVTVRPVEFTQFDSYTPTNTDTNKNLELLMDIKLELTVELGRCQLPVKKVLELTRGSIIELDKVAGESVELYANGKHVANGEVVVIEDNFGLRITSITDPEERIKSL